MRFRCFCILGRQAGSSTAGPTAGGPAVAQPSHAGRGRYPYEKVEKVEKCYLNVCFPEKKRQFAVKSLEQVSIPEFSFLLQENHSRFQSSYFYSRTVLERPFFTRVSSEFFLVANSCAVEGAAPRLSQVNKELLGNECQLKKGKIVYTVHVLQHCSCIIKYINNTKVYYLPKTQGYNSMCYCV